MNSQSNSFEIYISNHPSLNFNFFTKLHQFLLLIRVLQIIWRTPRSRVYNLPNFDNAKSRKGTSTYCSR